MPVKSCRLTAAARAICAVADSAFQPAEQRTRLGLRHLRVALEACEASTLRFTSLCYVVAVVLQETLVNASCTAA